MALSTDWGEAAVSEEGLPGAGCDPIGRQATPWAQEACKLVPGRVWVPGILVLVTGDPVRPHRQAARLLKHGCAAVAAATPLTAAGVWQDTQESLRLWWSGDGVEHCHCSTCHIHTTPVHSCTSMHACGLHTCCLLSCKAAVHNIVYSCNCCQPLQPANRVWGNDYVPPRTRNTCVAPHA